MRPLAALRLSIPLLLVAILTSAACATSNESATSAGGGDPGAGGTGGAGGGTGGNVGPCTKAVDCTAFTDACNVGTCINGECAKTPANEDVVCDDGLGCTLTEQCKAGVCTAITQKSCPASDACHVGTCDLERDGCIEAPGNDGQGCVDDDPCTLTGICSGGVCAPGQAVDCSFLNGPCSVGQCDSTLGCVAVALNDGDPCSDGFFCTDNDVCTGGVCAGAPKECVPPSNVCLTGSCDENNDVCITVAGNNGAACEDGSPCTQNETCSNGSCTGGIAANPGAACDDGNGCTGGTTCQGTTCAAPTSEITACIDADQCCPVGCADTDCIFDLLLVYADEPFYATDLQTKLQATGKFSGVDLYPAEFLTPTLAELNAYGAVLTWSNYAYANSSALGNVLADYYDGGGRVVVAPFANVQGSGLAGRFVNEGYMVLQMGPFDGNAPPASLGTVFEPQSELVAGVSSMSCGFTLRSLGSPAPGATTVAAWNDGVPLIVRGTVGGRPRADVNLFPPSNDVFFDGWVGDGAMIFANALTYD
jgi:hypothetical protein